MITSYNELTLGKYLQVMQVLQEDMEDIDRTVRMVAILNDMTDDEVESMPIADFADRAQALAFLYGEKPKHGGRITEKLKLDGSTYRITTNIAKLTTAQFIDFQTFAKEPQKYLVELLSVFILPEGKKYNDGYDIAEVQRLIRENITAPQATAIVSFFLTRLNRSAISTLIYLGWKLRKRAKKSPELQRKIQEAKTALRQNGAGLGVLM